MLPGLLIGIPALVLLLIVLAQIAGGAVWLPLIDRWLGDPPGPLKDAARRRR